jgi:hypothetical protein
MRCFAKDIYSKKILVRGLAIYKNQGSVMYKRLRTAVLERRECTRHCLLLCCTVPYQQNDQTSGGGRQRGRESYFYVLRAK